MFLQLSLFDVLSLTDIINNIYTLYIKSHFLKTI